MLGATWKAIRPSRAADSTKDPHSLRISLPPPPLPSEVFDSAEWYWYEGKRVRRAPRGHLDFDEEDYDVGSRLNLGTETPLSGSTSPYPFPSSRGSTYEGLAGSSSSGGVVPSSSTKLGPSARRPSLSSKNKVNREADRDCGICLETAVKPCRTRCCAKMFCSDHLNDWLGTSEHCPNCNTPMTIGGDHTVMLSSPLTAGSGETPKRGSSSPRRGSMTPQPSQLTPRRAASTSRFHISTPTDDSPSVGLPTPPPPYHLSTSSSSTTTSSSSEADTLKRLAHDLDFGVTSLLLSGAGTNGLDTPPVWTPNALQKASSRRGTGIKMSRPGIYDAVFSSEKETLTTASRLATLVAFVLLLYVVLG